MEIKGYYPEEELVRLIQEKKITWAQYVEHHSDEMTKDFHHFCRNSSLDKTEDSSAVAFLTEYEKLFLEGDVSEPLSLIQ